MNGGKAAAPARTGWLLLLFTVSGACGLVYEIVWMRRLALVFGSTTLAVSTVLAAFMGGLALGSLRFGRVADRDPVRALRVYGRLEIAIGILAVAVPVLLKAASAVYLGLEPALEGSPFLFFALQFVLAAGVLVLPTTLMGGTLPLLSRYAVASFSDVARRVGALYAANTLGAAAGVGLATYALLPDLGISAAERLAAAANLAVGGIALRLARSSEAPGREAEPAEAPAPEPAAPSGFRVLLWGAAASGLCAMVFEVAWSRTLAMVLGSSVYAFGMMLAIFLAGLSIGSAAFARTRLARAPVESFAAAQAGIAAAGLSGIYLVGQLPAGVVALHPLARESFFLQELVQLLMTVPLVLPAAILFGVAYPAVIAATTPSVGGVGRGVARVTVWNTAGTVAGAFLGGFVLVPRLGLRAAILFAAAASAAAALGALAASRRPARRPLLAAGLAIALLAAVFAPAWPRKELATGVGFFAGNYKTAADWRAAARALDLLFYKDGVSTTLSVDREEGHLYYRSNGKTDASTHPADMAVQVLIGQIGMMLHPDPKDVFVLGLGTGVSAAAVARHLVRSIDIVDIEPSGLDAAKFFEAENRKVLADPRVRYIAADGRNVLLARRKAYDVIISDPSDIWVAGVGNLFTKEFYETARARLKPGGVMVQWWHTHALLPEHLKMIVATFRSVFPSASYWRPNFGDVILAGTADPVPWDFERVKRKFETVPGLADDLRGIGIWSPAAFFGPFVLAGGDLDRLLADAPGIHTDDRPVIEFFAPRALYAETSPRNDAMIEAAQTRLFPDMENFDPARDLDPHETYLLGFARASMNRFDSAISLMEDSVRRDPSNPKAWIGLGNQYAGQSRPERAIAAYRSALAAAPGEPEASLELARMLAAQTDTDGAAKVLRDALARNPGDAALSAELQALGVK